MEGLVNDFAGKLEASLLALVRSFGTERANDWATVARVLAIVNELHSSVCVTPTAAGLRGADDESAAVANEISPTPPRWQGKHGRSADERLDEPLDQNVLIEPIERGGEGGEGEEGEGFFSSPPMEQAAGDGGAQLSACIEAQPMDPMQPVAGQGTVLLATWMGPRASAGSTWAAWSLWDSFGTAPFRVGKNCATLYATRGVVMRVTLGESTLVVRTNDRCMFQACVLGEAWPRGWLSSPFTAINALENLPVVFHKWTRGPTFASVAFSMAQNHVALGRATRMLPKQLRFTADGERLKAHRCAATTSKGARRETLKRLRRRPRRTMSDKRMELRGAIVLFVSDTLRDPGLFFLDLTGTEPFHEGSCRGVDRKARGHAPQSGARARREVPMGVCGAGTVGRERASRRRGCTARRSVVASSARESTAGGR